MGPKTPYRAGSVASGMNQLLEKGHAKVKLSEAEWDTLCAWIDINATGVGSYDENNDWNEAQRAWYKHRIDERQRNRDIEARNIAEFIRDGQPH